MPPFWHDTRFILALLLGSLAALSGGAFYAGIHTLPPIDSQGLLNLVLLYPCIEEILFRGFLSEGIERLNISHRRILGLSINNLSVSLVFCLAHSAAWTWPWLGLLLFPSLIFGWAKEHYRSIIPCIILHAAYNSAWIMGTINFR